MGTKYCGRRYEWINTSDRKRSGKGIEKQQKPVSLGVWGRGEGMPKREEHKLWIVNMDCCLGGILRSPI